MTKTNVEVFFGDELRDPTEQKFLRRLRADLEGLGEPALILANLEMGRPRRQVDFAIATAVRTVQCELKGYQFPVFGTENGRWEQSLPDGERRDLGTNPGRQANEATFAIGDTLGRFAKQHEVPGPGESGFKGHLDTVLCFYPEVPAGSEISVPRFVTVRSYAELLESLAKPGAKVPWSREHWHEFIREHQLFAIEARPALARREREEDYVTGDYCRRFLSSHRGALTPQVATGVAVDGEPTDDLDLAARLLEGKAISVFGPSGAGKTLMSGLAAVRLAESGQLPVWLDAAGYDGDFDALMGRATGPFTTFPARELMQIAASGGRRVVILLDGLNECLPELASDLLEQTGSLRLAYDAGALVSSIAPPALPETLAGSAVELMLPERTEKEAILAAYGAAELAPHSEAFSTPFELSIAAACAAEASDRPTRAGVLDAYVRRACGTEQTRDVVRALAAQMHAAVRGALRMQEVVPEMLRDGGVSAEAVDSALECRLVKVGQGRISFAHESFVRFLAAEALVIGSPDAAGLAGVLGEPANHDLRADALALESEERVAAVLASIEDEQVLLSAIVGDLGDRCQRAVEQIAGTLFERAATLIDSAVPHEIAAEPSDSAPHERGWDTDAEWSKPEEALLNAIGRALHRGRFIAGLLELFERTDELCKRRLEELSALTKVRPVSELIAGTYALPLMPSERWMAAAVILRGAQHDFSGRRHESRSVGVPGRLLRRAGAHSWGLLLLAAATARPFDPQDHEILPELLSNGWWSGAYHVRLAVLHLCHDAACSIKGPARARIIETMEGIQTNDLFVGSMLLETMEAYDMVAERPLEDVESELAAALAMDGDDPAARKLARGIVSNQFEPAGIVGNYYEAIRSLEQAGQAELYRRAASGAPADDLSTDTALIELAKIGDLQDPAVQSVFFELLRSPNPSGWHSAQWGMRSCLKAIQATARFVSEPVLPAHEAELAGWRPVFEILFWCERERLEGVDHSGPLHAAVAQLDEPTVRRAAATVLQMLRSSEIGLEPDERSAHDEVLDRLSAELRSLFEWTISHEDELTSCFRMDRGNETVEYAIGMLGRIGDDSSATLLRSLANNARHGTSARTAVRAIEERGHVRAPAPPV
jgi:hypothetical protein